MISFQNKLLCGLAAVAFAFSSVAATPEKPKDNNKYAAIVVDTDTKEVLYQININEKRYPASLTKLMTLYLTFDALRNGQLKMGEMLKVSAHAAEQQPTSLSLNQGEEISVEDCINGLIVRSANDCAVVLADRLAETEYFFSAKMTKQAEKLGMNSTRFSNSHGLPDKRNITTAADLAKLAIALKRDFPEFYKLFETTEFYYRGNKIISHNSITKCYSGATGLKTGFINDSGFNLASTISKDGKNILAIILGGDSALERDRDMVKILNMYYPGNTANPWANITPHKKEYSDACDRLGIVKDN